MSCRGASILVFSCTSCRSYTRHQTSHIREASWADTLHKRDKFFALARCWEWMIKIFLCHRNIFSRDTWRVDFPWSLLPSPQSAVTLLVLPKQTGVLRFPGVCRHQQRTVKKRNKTVSKLNFLPCRTSKTFYWKFTAGSRRAVANTTRVALRWIFHI